jgi:3-oxoacyl-[acyl-carrier-protein] synthase I
VLSTGRGADQIARSIVVEAAGLCCALGYHLDAAVCALRANMDHFQESGFYSLKSDPVVVATLPDEIHGQERLERWAMHAVLDCARRMAEPLSLFDARRTALIVIGPDKSRPHADAQFYLDVVLGAMRQAWSSAGSREGARALDKPYPQHEEAAMLLNGRTGVGVALTLAANMLAERPVEQVLLIGIDSYLNAADINAYLKEERLFVRGNSDGFIPGEAAAALVLRSAQADHAGLHIKGVGIAHEVGRHDGSVPSRSQGLTHAIRSACEQAGIAPTEVDFRISDQNGEQFFSRDASNAITRVMMGGSKIPHLTLADKIGEVGGAVGPAMLAWLLRDMPHEVFSPGRLALAHLANDDGTRCALVLQLQEKQ